MPLKPQDVLLVMKWALHPRERWTFAALAAALDLPLAAAHASVKRAVQAKLLARVGDSATALLPVRENLIEFLLHGLKYVFPAERGSTTRGVPTAHAAPVLRKHFAASGDLPPVWPDATGKARGEAFKPIYKTVAKAAAKDPALYSALALVDAIRGGSARERDLAAKLLTDIIAKAGA
jgi:hypothetical protein